MKILIITNSYPDHAESYRGVFIRKLGLELKRLGLDVVVLTPRVFRQSPAFEDDHGLRVYRFRYPSGGRPLGQSGAVPIVPMILYMASGFFKTMGVILKERPDVIHGNWIVPTGLIAAVAGYLTRIPVVNSAHGMDVRISARRPIGLLFDLAVRLSTKVTVVSESMRNRPTLCHAATIPFGVDESFFAVHASQRENRIISTRSLEPIYNLETLIRALPLVVSNLPETKCTVIGSGSQAGMLKNLAAELGISEHIDFVGRIENTAIPGYMSQAKVYVSTSLADGTSISLLEAIAAGLFPVVSDIDANRPWITTSTEGALFKPTDASDLAHKILHALQRSIPKQIEERRLTLKSEVSWPSIARRFLACYQASLRPSTRRGR